MTDYFEKRQDGGLSGPALGAMALEEFLLRAREQKSDAPMVIRMPEVAATVWQGAIGVGLNMTGAAIGPMSRLEGDLILEQDLSISGVTFTFNAGGGPSKFKIESGSLIEIPPVGRPSYLPVLGFAYDPSMAYVSDEDLSDLGNLALNKGAVLSENLKRMLTERRYGDVRDLHRQTGTVAAIARFVQDEIRSKITAAGGNAAEYRIGLDVDSVNRPIFKLIYTPAPTPALTAQGSSARLLEDTTKQTGVAALSTAQTPGELPVRQFEGTRQAEAVGLQTLREAPDGTIEYLRFDMLASFDTGNSVERKRYGYDETTLRVNRQPRSYIIRNGQLFMIEGGVESQNRLCPNEVCMVNFELGNLLRGRKVLKVSGNTWDGADKRRFSIAR